MKNIVVIPAVTPKDKNLDKFGGWNWMDISINAWKFWCKKNDCELVLYDKPSIEDTTNFRITVQRWFDIFDFLEKKKIEFDQVAMIDASSFPKWDCPNFFKLTNNKLTVNREMDNLGWVYEGIQGYKHVYDNYELDISKYFCASFVIFNKTHKSLFAKFKQNYIDNHEEFLRLQKTVRRGTDQTPLNYIVQLNNIDVTPLPNEYRVSHLQRKDLLSYNWQLNESKIPFFIKYGYVWFFSGFDKRERNELMQVTWDLIKEHYE
jgi:hypothetical protein